MFVLRGIFNLVPLLTGDRQYSRKKFGLCNLSSTDFRVKDKTFILTNSVDKGNLMGGSSSARHEISPHITEPQISVPFLQGPNTCPYP